LLAQIITKSWLANEDLSIEGIIGKILNPSFKKIGVLPLGDFYPQSDRFKLATKFNALLASPSFSLWLLQAQAFHFGCRERVWISKNYCMTKTVKPK
jgi:hypothetical protein